MRNGITASPKEKALATSRRTCSDTFALSENTRTNTRHESMPLMIPSVQSDPALMSRGAIQHLIPADSSCWQIASAVALSLLEWLIKTFNSIRAQRSVVVDSAANGGSQK